MADKEKKEVLEKKLDEYQEEYSSTKYNKATNKHLGILRYKIAKAKRDIEGLQEVEGQGILCQEDRGRHRRARGIPERRQVIHTQRSGERKIQDRPIRIHNHDPGPGGDLHGCTHTGLRPPGILEGAHKGPGRPHHGGGENQEPRPDTFCHQHESLAKLGPS